MNLNEAITELEEHGYVVNEGKIGRALGILTLGLSSIVNAYVPNNIFDIKNDNSYITLTQEELPDELKGGYVKYNAEEGEYIKCKNLQSIGQKICTIYDDNYNEKNYAMYDKNGDLISVKNVDSGVEFTQESSLLKPGYKIKNFEKGQTGFLLIDNGTKEILLKNGKFIKSVQVHEGNEKTFTKWENDEPIEDITYYDNDDKTIRTEYMYKTGQFTEYYITGTLKVEGQFDKSGKKTGEWIVYFENGQKAQKMKYKDGKLQGRVQCSDGRQGREGFDCRFNGLSKNNTYYNSKQDWGNPIDDFE